MRYPLKKINENDVCAEIGVWKGDFSSQILNQKPSQLHLIDPWVHQEHEWVKWAKGQRVIDAYEKVQSKFGSHENVFIHKKNSTDMFFGKAYFDWVYIDADHSYESVKKDLQHWYPQVKKGGFLCGDDYGWSHKSTDGPKPAVDEFVKSHNLKIEIRDQQFVIFV